MLYVTAAAVFAALVFFIWVALRGRTPVASLDDYLTARGSQNSTALGLSFLASGMGAWILFVPPEIGAFVGPVALVGYALSAALPFLLLAWLGPAIRQQMPQGRTMPNLPKNGLAKACVCGSAPCRFCTCCVSSRPS